MNGEFVIASLDVSALDGVIENMYQLSIKLNRCHRWRDL